jgi:hypothetical protein
MSPVAEALNDLLWATFPMRNILKGEARAKFLDIWNAGSKALCRDRFNADETPLGTAREAAVRLHRRCLETCAALGVKPHELVAQFNDRVDGGFSPSGDAADHVVLLGLEATRVARALNVPRETRPSEERAHVS